MNHMHGITTRGRFEELGHEECLTLLAAKSVGRIAFCSSSGPVVLPVNYVVQGEAVVFRTAAHNSLAANLNGAAAAFEVDDIDEYLESGWSVLIKGYASFVEDIDDTARDPRMHLEPWADGVRALYVRVTPHTITGRRVSPS
jgi:uncharacterized protein